VLPGSSGGGCLSLSSERHRSDAVLKTSAAEHHVISTEHWRDMGARLARSRHQFEAARSREMWDIGDWLITGENVVFKSLKKSKVRQMAAEITDYSLHTLRMAASVARKIKPSMRIDGLSWWHHLPVAKLDEKGQAAWLARAAEEEWSVQELRSRLRAQVTQPSTPPRRARPSRLVSELTQLHRDEIGDELLAKLLEWWQREVSRDG